MTIPSPLLTRLSAQPLDWLGLVGGGRTATATYRATGARVLAVLFIVRAEERAAFIAEVLDECTRRIDDASALHEGRGHIGHHARGGRTRRHTLLCVPAAHSVARRLGIFRRELGQPRSRDAHPTAMKYQWANGDRWCWRLHPRDAPGTEALETGG